MSYTYMVTNEDGEPLGFETAYDEPDFLGDEYDQDDYVDCDDNE